MGNSRRCAARDHLLPLTALYTEALMAVFTLFDTEAGPALKIPAADVASLALHEGSTLAATFVGEDLVLRPVRLRKYTAEELLAQCDYSLPVGEEEREWLDSVPVGRELI